jgi:hypothetical protein
VTVAATVIVAAAAAADAVPIAAAAVAIAAVAVVAAIVTSPAHTHSQKVRRNTPRSASHFPRDDTSRAGSFVP